MPPVAFGKVYIVAIAHKRHARKSWIAKSPKRRSPAGTDYGRSAGRMLKLGGGNIRCFSDDHHGGASSLKAPPRHRPGFDYVARYLAAITRGDPPLRRDRPNR